MCRLKTENTVLHSWTAAHRGPLRSAQSVLWVEIVEAAADFRDGLSGRFFEPREGPVQSEEAKERQAIWEAISSENESWRQWAHQLNRTSADISQLFGPLRLRDSTRLPDWAQHARDLISFVKQRSLIKSNRPFVFRSPSDPLYFLPLCIPAARYAIARLDAECAPKLLRKLSPFARRKLYALVVSQLLAVITPAGACFARLKLKRSTSSRLSSYSMFPRALALEFFSPSPEVRLLELLREFPALGRLVVDVAAGWQNSTTEFLERLHMDWMRLRSSFSLQRTARTPSKARILDLQLGLSDPHDHGRTVVAARLLGGSWIIYKPRNCRGELEWGRLVRCLRDQQLRPSIPNAISKADYGWMEFVRFRPCRSVAEVRRFYQRAGALICIAQIARATDLHRDNVIAAGSQPVIVDLETLWQPYLSAFALNAGIDCGLPPLCRTGLLPMDAGNFPEQVPPAHALDSATDQNHLQKHRPHLRGRSCRACDFAADVEEGFRRAAIDLCGNRRQRARCSRVLIRIALQRWRQIRRPTARYAEMRELARDPRLLRNSSHRYLAILKECAAGNVPPEIAAAEAESLAQFNIPRFTTAPAAFALEKRVDYRETVKLLSLSQMLEMLAQINAALNRAALNATDV